MGKKRTEREEAEAAEREWPELRQPDLDPLLTIEDQDWCQFILSIPPGAWYQVPWPDVLGLDREELDDSLRSYAPGLRLIHRDADGALLAWRRGTH